MDYKMLNALKRSNVFIVKKSNLNILKIYKAKYLLTCTDKTTIESNSGLTAPERFISLRVKIEF